MNRNILKGGVALGVLAGLAAAAHLGSRPPASSPSVVAPPAAPSSPDWTAFPLNAFRVVEEEHPGRVDFSGRDYQAAVGPAGLRFEAGGHFVEMGATALVQGGRRVELGRAEPGHPAFARATIDRGAVVEEYVFENGRVEQVFHVPHAVGKGALQVEIPFKTSMTGQVREFPRGKAGWKDSPLGDGALVFTDAEGRRKIAYHGAVAIDARGRKIDLDPICRGDRIILEVPGKFMETAAFPVMIDPWLELDFSASGGGVSGTAAVSQTPVLAIDGGGNPYVVWAEEAGGDFEIYLRFWNGFKWFDLGGSNSGGGISDNAGDSTNPTISLVSNGNVFVAWEDDTNGNIEIYMKKWDGLNWVELAGSATLGGVSQSTGESTHPSISQMQLTVPSLNTRHTVPVIAWQDTVSGALSIHCAAYFPGDPGNPDNIFTVPDENFPVIPERWYGIAGSFDYTFIGGLSGTPGGFVSEKPKLALFTSTPATPTSNRVATAAWQDTRNGNYEIYLRQHALLDDSLFDPSTPRYPAQTIPVWSNPGGTWSGLTGVSIDSDSGGGISNTAGAAPIGLSINPDMGLNAAGNPYLAWEEALSSTTSEIRAMYWTGADWATAGSTLSVSDPAGTGYLAPNDFRRSTTPALAVAPGGAVFVAWSDNEPGNTEIYVKRAPSSGAPWESVGFDPSFGISSTGLGGISRTFAASIFPTVRAGFGPVVAWQDFSNGQFEIYLKRFYENEPRLLRQTVTVGGVTTEVPFGTSTTEETLELRGTLFSESTARAVRLQVEVRPIDSDFVGTVTAQTELFPVDAVTHLSVEAIVYFTGLVNVSYHWRARTVDDIGQASSWVSAGSNADGQTDFTVSAIPPVPPEPPTNLVAAANGLQIDLSWDPPPGGQTLTYRVYRDTATGPLGSKSLVASGITATSFTDGSGLAAGTTYFYMVTAVDVAGQESLASNEASATTPSPPATAPTVSTTSAPSEITLNWTPVSGATSYIVQRSTVTGGPYTIIASGVTILTYTDSGLPASTTFFYRVAGTNAAGTGPYSVEVSDTTPALGPPPAPTGLTATAGSGEILLDWTAPPGGPYSYNVRRSTVSGGPYVVVATGVTTTSFTDTGLPSFTTFFYVVSAQDGFGESANSQEASATTLAPSGPPSAPVNLTATAGATSITLDWTAPPETPVSYNVRRAISAGGPYEVIATGVLTTTYTDSGLPAPATFYYVVTAVNGQGESGFSNEASATTTGVTGPPQAPGSPTNLTATGGAAQISLTWTAPSVGLPVSYNVHRSTTSGGPYLAIATGVTATAHVDVDATPGVTFYYVVTAVNSLGESAPSNEASAVASTGTGAPPPPTDLVATAASSTGVSLSWLAPPGGSVVYNVKRSTKSGGPYTTIETGLAVTSYGDGGLSTGTTYFYVVTAQNGQGESENSNQASATPASRKEDDKWYACGLLGAEALAMLGLLALARRRRSV